MRFIVSLFCLTITFTAFSLQFDLPDANTDVVGTPQTVTIGPKDNFVALAQRFDVGYFELAAANPEIDPEHLKPHTLLVIPTQYILPPVPRTGLIIDLGTMRLFYFPAGKNYFYIYPVGIGKEDWDTPLGILSIIEKIKDPIWHVPQSIYEFRQKNGDPVPHFVPAGPKNPLGDFAMRLSKPTFLIHGTNDPASVGVRSSAGCIHLYPEDIQALFEETPVNTPVFIINEPIIAGFQGDTLWLEAHLPLVENRKTLGNPADIAHHVIEALLTQTGKQATINWDLAAEVVQEQTGIPVQVGTGNTSDETSNSALPTPEKTDTKPLRALKVKPKKVLPIKGATDVNQQEQNIPRFNETDEQTQQN